MNTSSTRNRVGALYLASLPIIPKNAKRLASCLMIAVVMLTAVSATRAAVKKSTQTLMLGDTGVNINIYENPAARITFFAPHHNEQIGISAAKEYVERKGGRFIEVESLNEEGRPIRNLYFKIGEETFSVDPNRIYTENGRRCAAPELVAAAVKSFADELLKIILAPDGARLRDGEAFLVAVHNNSDVSARMTGGITGDLTAYSYLRSPDSYSIPHGMFSEQAAGIYLSNMEPDIDNFIYLTATDYVSFFASYGFNVVVQRPATYLNSTRCSMDDGSLSVYSAQNAIPYICFEADMNFGRSRQNLMFDATYKLLDEQKPAAPEKD